MINWQKKRNKRKKNSKNRNGVLQSCHENGKYEYEYFTFNCNQKNEFHFNELYNSGNIDKL